MLDPETITVLQGFANGIAQNLISSAIVEWKKQKDDNKALEAATLLEDHEHSKALEERIAQKICDAFRNLSLSEQELNLILPLVSDAVFGGALARQILEDRYSSEEIAKLIVQASPSSESLGSSLRRLASVLIDAIQRAIADDPHLCRTKELRFQFRVTQQIAEVKAETSKTQETIRQSMQGVMEAVSNGLPSMLKLLSDNTYEKETREKIHHDRVEQARKLLESDQPKTARRMLEELRKETAKLDVSKSLLIRIATNIGCCAIQLDDNETAVREIELAYQLNPDNPKSIANLAAINLLKGKPQEALELAGRARENAPQDSVATANYIQALFSLSRDAELDRLIENEGWITKDSNCCFALGKGFFDGGRFADSERFLRLGLATDPTDARLLILLAHSLIRPIQTTLLGQPILDWRFPTESTPKLQEALGLLNQAIAIRHEFEDRPAFAFAHVLRADVHRMLRDSAAAISDCDIALHQNPTDQAALSIKALAHLHEGQFNEAIQAFEKLEDTDAKQRLRVPWASAYNAAGKPQKAIELLDLQWEASPSTLDQIKVADQLLWAYSQLGDTTAAENIITRLKAAWANNSEVLSVIGRFRRKQGMADDAIGLFSEALAYATGPQRDFIAWELADLFYERREFAKAAELYQSFADLTTDNDLSRQYLICLYNSGPHKEALRLAKALRGSGEPLLVISQIEANILSEIGDTRTAQEIMARLSQLHPTIHAYKIGAAEFAMRRGQHTDARAFLERIPFDEIRKDPNILFRIARLRAVLGMGQILKYLYQARRSGYASSDIHAAYVALFVTREKEDEAELLKDSVDGDCGVLLKIGNVQEGYTILSEKDLHVEQGEISLEQARKMQILGRKKGETFISAKGPFGSDIECTVVDVQSKYVRAFQQTLEKFPTLFPADQTLQGIEGPYEKFRDGMLQQLDVQQQEIRKVTNVYETRQITFESLAGVLRCPPVELWGMLIGGRYCTFANFSGTMEDAQAEADVASHSDAIVLDLTAILTFGQLGLLDRLNARYKLFTIQPVLDALAEAHAKAAVSKPSLTIGKDGDTYVQQEISADALVAQKLFFERIIQFLKQRVTTLPVPSLLDKDPIVTDDLRRFLGPISTAALFAARDEKLPLFSDDQVLRLLARNEWKIRGMSVQPVLHELTIKNLVTKDECTAAISKLFFLNYSVVLINADNVLWVFDKVQYRMTADVSKILTVFHGPQCTFESAVEVLADVTKRVWLEGPLYHLKVDLVDGILDALGTNRPTEQVAEHFSRAIKWRLFLAPHVGDAIAERIRLWKERKLGRAGIIVSSRYRTE
jgi:tetratricopeptide (TPR) repeat protein